MNENNKILSEIDFLVQNLTPKDEQKKIIIEDSVKRELMIGQILKDQFSLDINNDPVIFQMERITIYIEVIFSKENTYDKILTNYIKRQIYLRNSKTLNLTFSIYNRDYQISIGKYWSLKYGDKNFSLYTDIRSTRESISSDSISNSSKKSQILSNPYLPKIFEEKINNDKFYIMMIQRTHEIDGSFITNEIITDLKELKELMIYPKKKDNIFIDKGERIIVEVKQNATLNSIYNQMKDYMKDISEIHPDKNFHYFGFINESNYNLLKGNNILDENLFIQKIEEEMKSFKNFKIYIFIIKNNKLFQYSLDEQLLYGIHYYNMTEKKINEYRQETKDLEKKIEKIENVENKLQKQMENLEIKLNNIENMISNLALKNKREENQNSNNSRFNNNFRFHRGRTFGYNRGRTYYHNGRARRFRFYRK